MNKYIIVLLLSLLMFSCKTKKTEEIELIDSFNVLIEYLENNGNLINSEHIPWFITATEVYENLDENVLIIDIRSEEDFNNGHIQTAVNIKPQDLIDYFENSISPPHFDKIVLCCNAGNESAFCAMGLKYLGYNMVYPLRNGLSSWSYDIAADFRLKNRGNLLINDLDTLSHSKNDISKFPEIKSELNDSFLILRQRIIEILDNDIVDYFISLDDYLQNPDSYYLISYWPESRYKSGHIKNAIQYTPKSSLSFDEYLNTLPVDMPIVIDCYAGNHSNFVIMFLRILGYNAYTMEYGANNYMFDIIKTEERASRHFSEKDIMDYPLSSKTQIIQQKDKEESKETDLPVGGC